MKTISFIKGALLIAFPLFLISAAETGIFEGVCDVGNPKLNGNMSYNKATDTYTLTGAGANIWEKTDEFFFAWKKVTGDFSMSTKLCFEGINPEHRKIGIMIRETLDGDSKYADISVHGDGLNSLQWRPEKGENTLEIASATEMPDHITLERRGNKIIMKTAIGNWADKIDAAQRVDKFPAGTETTVELPATCYIGFFICSHVEDKIEKAYFSDVRFKKL
jgi:hypothetical protein